jgi:hypothetical protein
LDAARLRRLADRAAESAAVFGFTSVEHVPIRWGHLIDENTRQFMNVEHVLVGKAGPLFRNMLRAIVASAASRSSRRARLRIAIAPPAPHRRRAASLVLNFGARSMLRVTEVQKLSG